MSDITINYEALRDRAEEKATKEAALRFLARDTEKIRRTQRAVANLRYEQYCGEAQLRLDNERVLYKREFL